MMTTTMMTTSTAAAPTMIHSHGTPATLPPRSPALSSPTAWRLPFSSRTSFQVTVLPFFSALPEASVTLPGKVTETLASTPDCFICCCCESSISPNGTVTS